VSEVAPSYLCVVLAVANSLHYEIKLEGVTECVPFTGSADVNVSMPCDLTVGDPRLIPAQAVEIICWSAEPHFAVCSFYQARSTCPRPRSYCAHIARGQL
jgi:hypothetical protein